MQVRILMMYNVMQVRILMDVRKRMSLMQVRILMIIIYEKGCH